MGRSPLRAWGTQSHRDLWAPGQPWSLRVSHHACPEAADVSRRLPSWRTDRLTHVTPRSWPPDLRRDPAGAYGHRKPSAVWGTGGCRHPAVWAEVVRLGPSCPTPAPGTHAFSTLETLHALFPGGPSAPPSPIRLLVRPHPPWV